MGDDIYTSRKQEAVQVSERRQNPQVNVASREKKLSQSMLIRKTKDESALTSSSVFTSVAKVKASASGG
jgi:hypothetical protein